MRPNGHARFDSRMLDLHQLRFFGAHQNSPAGFIEARFTAPEGARTGRGTGILLDWIPNAWGRSSDGVRQATRWINPVPEPAAIRNPISCSVGCSARNHKPLHLVLLLSSWVFRSK